MNWVLILQYFKIRKLAYMTQKTVRFEYVTRVYPNGIQNPQLTHLWEGIIIETWKEGYP